MTQRPNCLSWSFNYEKQHIIQSIELTQTANMCVCFDDDKCSLNKVFNNIQTFSRIHCTDCASMRPTTKCNILDGCLLAHLLFNFVVVALFYCPISPVHCSRALSNEQWAFDSLSNPSDGWCCCYTTRPKHNKIPCTSSLPLGSAFPSFSLVRLLALSLQHFLFSSIFCSNFSVVCEPDRQSPHN